MNAKSNLKYVWFAVAVCSLVSTAFLWFGYDAPNLQNAIYALNALALLLSLPCSLFAVLVVALSKNYLGIEPFSSEGIYLMTIFTFVCGAMQWFWVARFWSPTEAVYQNLNLVDAETR